MKYFACISFILACHWASAQQQDNLKTIELKAVEVVANRQFETEKIVDKLWKYLHAESSHVERSQWGQYFVENHLQFWVRQENRARKTRSERDAIMRGK